MKEDKVNSITSRIIKSYYNVYNTLGFGFLEKVYENSLVFELQKQGLHGRRQVPIEVNYLGNSVGSYFADIIVDNLVILEIKVAEALCEAHEAQLLNYLRATNIEYGLLLNFGQKPEIRRKVWTNEYNSKRNMDLHDDRD
ncbi:MAG: GxxExxY protein [Candidatus Magasanikbacteria bacterium CG10_big_fil_rev_8_21_14_0_10_36_16]|uniref:GxxExxY protein n=1 Tax=Candidatus Magasanikbacteria bacterium CG10_big_fil_rev_8_21_14_0_10_36_16 TaxID=1974645 RepID=A0A2H0TYY1_9BACT|nr:MAG: GxxExxY protein [Candidatus Magasanikbacteria bacterium CG10_big_fil_rev_8_21_14_0_10_36_16]